MSTRSKISWTDVTWNVVLGCSRVSAGCDSCYAIGQARMRAANPNPKIAAAFAGLTERTETGVDWTGRVNALRERLGQPLRWRKPRRVFVNSLADLFHDNVPEEFIAEVFAVMAAAHWHTFQVLTKRHGRMRALLNSESFHDLVKTESAGLAHEGVSVVENNPWENWPLPNVWLGVSVEDQRWADIRIPALLDTPAAVRWISAEPLLGPIDLCGPIVPGRGRPKLTYWLDGRPYWDELKATTTNTGLVMTPLSTGPRIDWVVVGGESGHRARAMHPQWARALRNQCTAAGVPFHFKQWGEWGPAPFVVRVCDPKLGWHGTDEELEAAKRDSEARGATHVHTGNQYRDDAGELRYHLHEIGHKPWSRERGELGDDWYAPIRRWGKKAAGRELDGRIWDEYPGEVADVR